MSHIWYICKYCKRAYRRRKYLVRHKREFHPQNEIDDLENELSAVHEQSERSEPTDHVENLNVDNKDQNIINPPISEISLTSTTTSPTKKGTSQVEDCQNSEDDEVIITVNSYDSDDTSSVLAVSSSQDEDQPMMSYSDLDDNNNMDQETDKSEGKEMGEETINNKGQGSTSSSSLPKLQASRPSPPKVNLAPPPEIDQQGKMKRKKQLFECVYCKKKITSLQGLKIHERVHTGEKPYQCRYCPKTFASAQYATNHERVHFEKQFKCPHCPKSYTSSQSRKAHVKRFHS